MISLFACTRSLYRYLSTSTNVRPTAIRQSLIKPPPIQEKIEKIQRKVVRITPKHETPPLPSVNVKEPPFLQKWSLNDPIPLPPSKKEILGSEEVIIKDPPPAPIPLPLKSKKGIPKHTPPQIRTENHSSNIFSVEERKPLHPSKPLEGEEKKLLALKNNIGEEIPLSATAIVSVQDALEKHSLKETPLLLEKRAEPKVLEGDLFSYVSSDSCDVVLLGINPAIGEALQKTYQEFASFDLDRDKIDILALSSNSDLTKWKIKSSVKTVVLAVDNQGINTSENRRISLLISTLLGRDLNVKIAIPRTELNELARSFAELSESPKGARKCARAIKGAILIHQSRDLTPINNPLQDTLQKLVERRERDATGASSKESIESRIRSANSIYSKGRPIAPDGVTKVNLLLRGIDFVPPTFRETLIPHPDLSELENETILDSEDKKIGVIQALKDLPSLENRVISLLGQYWTVVSDIRWKKECGSHYLSTLEIKNSKRKLTLNFLEDKLFIIGKEIPNPNKTVKIHSFKLYTRIIPYYSAKGELTGIERTFFGPNAKKPSIGKRRHKLARGVTAESSSIFYGSKNPKIKILGEGAENVLSSLQVALNSSEVRAKLGLILDQEKSNCHFVSALGVSDLIKTPIEESVEQIILLVDIDGHNVETKQTIIDTVSEFLSRAIEVKIIFAPASEVGGKSDLNDALITSFDTAEKRMLDPVEIKNKEDLGSPLDPLQTSLAAIKTRKMISTSFGKTNGETWFLHGKAQEMLGQLKEAITSYQNALEFSLPQDKAKVHGSLGNIYLKIEDYDLALDHFQRSLKGRLLQSGSSSDEMILNALEGMGSAYSGKNLNDLALSYFANALQEKINLLGSDKDPTLFPLLCEIGSAELKARNFGRALIHFQKAISLKEIELGTKNHIDISRAIEKAGDVFFTQKKYKEALGLYKEAQEILHKLYCTERYTFDQDLSLKMANIYFHLNQRSLAFQFFRKALFDRDEGKLPETLINLLKRAQVIELAEKTKLSSQKVVSRHPRTPPPIPRPSVTKHKAIDITILRERAGKTRQVVIDLEMTGSSPQIDRITDIGCVSLVNLQKTGEFFQRYVNPERSVRHEAYRLTGLTQSFLINYRLFSEVADEFLRFIKGADLIFHGSSSDLLFFAKELERAGKNYELEKKHFIIDTYDIAKSLFPEQRHSLDALNSSLNINIPRPKHGALVDAEITADAYIKMLSLEGLKRKD